RISAEGLYVSGQFHLWNRLGTGLKRVVLEGHNPVELVFTITYFSRFGPGAYDVRVPVPPGEEATAERVMTRLSSRPSSSRSRQ
ncbi:MAG: hypothetical protein GX601_11885, partial [Anaerolineales bacterium]|nr:hypothetical protein [Anaerolineales bacterium]